jgi:transcriptional regulator of acetoin/glycerol metabolism
MPHQFPGGASRSSGSPSPEATSDPARVPPTYLLDPDAATSRLRHSWDRYHTEGTVETLLREPIVSSWERSQRLGISPDRQVADVDETVLERLEVGDDLGRWLLHAARPVMEDLAGDLSGTDTAIVIGDQEGHLIERLGDPAILRRTARRNFVPGSGWGEHHVGTNGIGLALALDRPAQVFSAEHFCVGFHGYACTAAPIHHPVTGQTMGVLDVTTRANVSGAHTFALLVEAVRNLEHELERQISGRERELLEQYLRGRAGRRVPVLTVDRAGRTIVQNAAAVRSLAPEDLEQILGLVQQALRDGRDRQEDVPVSWGRVRADVGIARAHSEVLGALITVHPFPHRPPAARQHAGSTDWLPLTGRSEALRDLARHAGLVADECRSALIEGGPGTGKLRLARAMHARSPRAGAPLHLVACVAGTWRDGWRRAAEAGAACIVLLHPEVLDEAAQLELAVLLQTHEASLPAEQPPWLLAVASSGWSLRPELRYRLAPPVLRVPALRDRPEDLEALVAEWCAEQGRLRPPRPTIAPSAHEVLRRHQWPGNVRELRHALADAALLARSGTIWPRHLRVAAAPEATPEPSHLQELEQAAIRRALAENGQNVSRAAAQLGISRATLHRRLNAYRRLEASSSPQPPR